jgi:sugar lactone lactonase YvrE
VGATSIATGDLLVCDRDFASPIVVNSSTGTQAIFPSATLGSSGISDAVSLPDGRIFICYSPGSAIFSMAPVSGELTLVASQGQLQFPSTLAAAPDGILYVVETGSGDGVVRVDPSTGQQSQLVSGFVESIAIDGQGNCFVVRDSNAFVRSRRHIYRLDLGSGVLTRFSNLDLHEPGRLSLDGSGGLIVLDNQHDVTGPPCSIFRIDTATEVVSTVSEAPQFMRLIDAVVAADGTIIVADAQSLTSCAPPGGSNSCPGALYEVNPSTGAAQVLSSGGLFFTMRGLEIYRGPSTVTPTTKSSWGRLKAMYR